MAALVKYFPAATDPDVANGIQQLIDTFGFSAEDLHYKWEAFALPRGANLKLADALPEFRHHLQYEISRPKKKAKVSTPSHLRPKVLATPTRQIQTVPGKPHTPTPNHTGGTTLTSDIPSSPSFTQYANRGDRGKIVETLNTEIAPSSQAGAPVKCVVHSKTSESRYRTMYQKLTDAGCALDDQIERVSDLLIEHGILEADQIRSPALITQDDVYVVGRISSDSLNGSRLTPTTTVLEASRRVGRGLRVPLNLEALPEYSLFQGQILAAKGCNPTGKEFVVKEFVELPQMPSPQASEETLSRVAARKNNASIMIATGPYTTQDNLDFEPLADFVAKVRGVKPSGVVLIGPFLESNHPLVLSGDAQEFSPDETMSSLFQKRVSTLLAQLDTELPVVIIPSLRDSVVEHMAYPQAPFSQKTLGLPENCYCLSNPASFSFDEAVFTVTSVDALYELVRSATKRAATTLPSVNLAFRHILRQRRIYPSFPSQETSFEESTKPGVSLDVPHLFLGDFEDVAPHILVVPSSVRYCCQVIDNVICINPGTLLRRQSGGTYALLTIGEGTEPLHSRTRVDIYNI